MNLYVWELTCDHDVVVLAPDEESSRRLANKCVEGHGAHARHLAEVLDLTRAQIVAVFPGYAHEHALNDIDTEVTL